jgi:hypothetical protein
MDAIPGVDDVWNELHRCFNCSFPIGGAPKEFPKVGDKLPLEIRMAGQKLDFPVQVTEIQKTPDAIDIEFLTLPGHIDGPNSTIHFRFYQESAQLHLGIRGYITQGPGTGTSTDPLLGPLGIPGAPLERVGYTWFADNVIWQQYIDRLMYNIKAHPSGPPLAQL